MKFTTKHSTTDTTTTVNGLTFRSCGVLFCALVCVRSKINKHTYIAICSVQSPTFTYPINCHCIFSFSFALFLSLKFHDSVVLLRFGLSTISFAINCRANAFSFSADTFHFFLLKFKKKNCNRIANHLIQISN